MFEQIKFEAAVTRRLRLWTLEQVYDFSSLKTNIIQQSCFSYLRGRNCFFNGICGGSYIILSNERKTHTDPTFINYTTQLNVFHLRFLYINYILFSFTKFA